MHRTRTTISCRFVAQIVALAATLAAASNVSAQPQPAFPTEIVWSVQIPSAPAGPPVVGGGRVVVALGGQLVARRASDGKEAWTSDLAATGALVADDHLVLVPAKGAVHALAIESGERRWSVETRGVTAPPLLKGGWVILAAGEELTALSAVDGDLIWTTKIALIEQRPAIDGNLLYVAVADGRVVALDLESGALRWESKVGANPTEPFPYGDRVYTGANGTHFVCIKASNGRVDWASPIGAEIRGAAAADASRVYTASMDNLLRAFNRSNGAIEWKQDLGYRPLSGPILVGSTVGVGGRSATIRVFTTTGGKAAQLTLPDPAVTAPAYAKAPAGRPGYAKATGGIPDVALASAGKPAAAKAERGKAPASAAAQSANGADREVPSAAPAALAFITGDPGRPYLLSLTGEPAPALPDVTPLTALPGEVLPPMQLPGG